MNKPFAILLTSIVLACVGQAVAQPLTGKKPIVPVPNRNIQKPLSAEEQQKHFLVPEGFEVELVAAEPTLINPITMAFDEKGRLYVSESHTYRYGPNGSPVKPFRNPVVRLDPLPGGKGYKRVPVADGFDDPVMGIAVHGDKLWLTANNFLYQYDLAEDGTATNRRTLLTDKNKAWNPFGMFVIKPGPDGMMYLSVGNHAIDIGGPTNRVGGRGSSGIVCRMKPDGSDLERLVHGLRVPYSFDYDPFGQLWLLSNGEGNPDRFVRVIEGVDYHCYSRPGADSTWLAGDHPLAPPCFELGRGASTQLLRYFGSGFPADYQGSLLGDNWGAHGFNGPNRAVLRFVPNDRGQIVRTEGFVACADPHFRASHIVVDPDGNLLVCDWYGRDDESDLTGRLWRIKYTGKERLRVEHELDSARWNTDDYALTALGSPHHRIREKALETLLAQGPKKIAKLAEHAATGKEAIGAANALWALARLGTAEARTALASGAKHPDWRVRRLAIHLLRRHQVPTAADVAGQLAADADPAVRVEAALARGAAGPIRTALLDALRHGAAADPHLRYESAWHLARQAEGETFAELLKEESADLRLAGLIALDVACYENFPSRKQALETLARALGETGRAEDIDHLLTLARLNWDPALLPGMTKLVNRADVPVSALARTLLLLRTRGVNLPVATLVTARKQFLDAVDRGTFRLTAPADAALYLEFLEAEGPTEAGLKQLGRQLTDGSGEARSLAHALARKFGTRAAVLAELLWKPLLDERTKPEDRIELLATLSHLDNGATPERWEKLLNDRHAGIRAEAIRSWRAFKGRAEMVALLTRAIPALARELPAQSEDLVAVLAHLETAPEKFGLTVTNRGRDALANEALAALPKLTPADRTWRARTGRLVFERLSCVKCHTTVNQDTPLAPSLKTVAKGQKPEYLVESVLHPSKVIKTGFETELIVTRQGKTLTGLVKDDGDAVRLLTADNETRIAKKDIEQRLVQKLSLMPEGQEKQMSRDEFLDLMVYLQSLR